MVCVFWVATWLAELEGMVTFAKPKSSILAWPRLVTKILAGFYVPVDDPFGVRRVERIRDLNRKGQQVLGFDRVAVIMCFSVTPSRNSMAMKACPSCCPIS
jgi:hypothetical protein